MYRGNDDNLFKYRLLSLLLLLCSCSLPCVVFFPPILLLVAPRRPVARALEVRTAGHEVPAEVQTLGKLRSEVPRLTPQSSHSVRLPSNLSAG